MTLRAHILQHVPFEGPGQIADWLHAQQAQITASRLYAGDPLPALDDFDLLVVMGGPMSVNDVGEYPWLLAETAFILAAIRADKAVLGICLGAQLIASALGSRVYRNPTKEIGWWPVQPVAAAELFPESFPVFHWHGETFDLPLGAVQLARSGACEQQAFRYGRRAMGLQFHLEMTPHTVQSMIEHGRDELCTAPWIQPAAAMLAVPEEHYRRTHSVLATLLASLTTPA